MPRNFVNVNRSNAATNKSTHYQPTEQDLKDLVAGTYSRQLETELLEIWGSACKRASDTFKRHTLDKDVWQECCDGAWIDLRKGAIKLLERGDYSNVRSYLLGSVYFGICRAANKLINASDDKLISLQQAFDKNGSLVKEHLTDDYWEKMFDEAVNASQKDISNWGYFFGQKMKDNSL